MNAVKNDMKNMDTLFTQLPLISIQLHLIPASNI